MSGNVSESVQDCWPDNYQGVAASAEAWVSDCADTFRTVRGGVWITPAANTQLARRGLSPPPKARNNNYYGEPLKTGQFLGFQPQHFTI